ncbi:hypothetical protein ACFL2Q_19535 [Thermodesulfobacteriota bacterium]
MVGLVGKRPKASQPVERHSGEIFVIYNYQVFKKPAPVSKDLSDIIDRTFDTLFRARVPRNLRAAYVASQMHGYGFNVLWIPDGIDAGINSLAFDNKTMRKVFAAGRDYGNRSAHSGGLHS